MKDFINEGKIEIKEPFVLPFTILTEKYKWLETIREKNKPHNYDDAKVDIRRV